MSSFHTIIAFSYAKILNTISLTFKACFKRHIEDIFKGTRVSLFSRGCSKKNYQLNKDYLWSLFTRAFLLLLSFPSRYSSFSNSNVNHFLRSIVPIYIPTEFLLQCSKLVPSSTSLQSSYYLRS